MTTIILPDASSKNRTTQPKMKNPCEIEKLVETRPGPYSGTDKTYKWEFVWTNIFAFLYLHLAAIYGIYLSLTTTKLISTFSMVVLIWLSGLGVTAGTHRLWSHRAYKTKMPLSIFLMILQTIAFQNHIYEWCRDHRVHHKYTDTDADPHNAKRGFFFSHVGWLMVKKHKLVKVKGKQIDMSDLEADPVVQFQKNYYRFLMPLLAFVLPTLYLHRVCGETISNGWYMAVARWMIQVNCTWCVNSVAHIWGSKPYDVRIGPTENGFVEAIALGEGFHNYHHVFPWDYKAAELPTYKLNFTTAFIDLMARIGQAYDLKIVSPKMIARRALRTGDGSFVSKNKQEECVFGTVDYKKEDLVWGWGDKDMSNADIKDAKVE